MGDSRHQLESGMWWEGEYSSLIERLFCGWSNFKKKVQKSIWKQGYYIL